jgi:hypothetical protein
MIAEVAEIAGHEAAERLRQDLELIERLTEAPRRPRWWGASDMDRDEQGDLLVHRENLPAVVVWLQVHDQWIRAGMDGEPVGLDMRVALEFTRELAACHSERVDVLDTTARLRILASEVLTLQRQEKRR